MIFRLFSDSIVGLIIGNIFRLTKKLLGKEDSPIWISQPYYKYSDFKDYAFLILWIIMAISLGYFFVTFPELQDTGAYYIGTFFLITGMLLMLRLPHTMDRLYIYSDRVERKTLLHTTYTIPFSSIESIFKVNQNFVDITYYDQTFGLLVLCKHELWKIPAKIFTDPRLNTLNSKLHLDQAYTYNEQLGSLQKNVGLIDKVLIASVLIFNPYTIIASAAFLFGVFFTSPLLFLLTDFSKIYCSFCYKMITKKDRYPVKTNVPDGAF